MHFWLNCSWALVYPVNTPIPSTSFRVGCCSSWGHSYTKEVAVFTGETIPHNLLYQLKHFVDWWGKDQTIYVKITNFLPLYSAALERLLQHQTLMGCSLPSKHTDLFTLLTAAPLYPGYGADATAEEVGVFTRKKQTQPTNTRQPLNTQLGNSTLFPFFSFSHWKMIDASQSEEK